jgi:SAM-dependent methyltransferase
LQGVNRDRRPEFVSTPLFLHGGIVCFTSDVNGYNPAPGRPETTLSFVGEPYLEPYLRAARKFGSGFQSLLWASPRTQRTRFEAIAQMCDPAGKRLLDAGCGRADFLEFLVERGIQPDSYVGVEGVEELAAAAEAKRFAGAAIVRADFVREPLRLFAGADLVVFSGSLNTLRDQTFYSTIRAAYDAASEALAFNFLCSDYLAGREYLFWRRREDVLKFARRFCADVRVKDDYLQGDCTVCLSKPGDGRDREDVHA